MKYKGRIITPLLVFVIHVIYITYYYYKYNVVEIIEWIGLPVLLILAWVFGKKYDKAIYYSEKDELTNLYNRRFIVKIFPKILALTNRNNQKLFLLMLDCNNFKAINDRYGHTTGDKVLKQIAQILLNTTRTSDLVSRWGGDEFIIIGQYKDPFGAEVVMNRIEKEASKYAKKTDIDISLSIGSAIYPIDGESLNELIKIADQRMYAVKK